MITLGISGIIKALGAEKAVLYLMGSSIIVPEVIKNYHTLKEVLTSYPNAYILYETVLKLL